MLEIKFPINHLKYLKDILKEIFSDLENEKLKKNIILFQSSWSIIR
jgi:hypothetical protein